MIAKPVLLMDYADWANDIVLAGLRQLDPNELHTPIRPGYLGPLAVLVHIMAAEHIWLSRWKGESPVRLFTANDLPSLDSLQGTWQTLRSEMRDFLTGVGNTDQVVIYRTTRGDEHRDPLWLLVLHVVNHGTEHRSQLALFLAARGIDLGNLDLISYLRKIK